jgi:hypothetical protein
MWQLICHHTYKCDGYAIDLSPFANDGQVSERNFTPAGASADSGALWFETQNARVTIPPNDRWRALGALKVEAVARIDSGRNAMRDIAFGEHSFAFGIDADGQLFGALWNGPAVCRSDSAGAPDGRARTVPTDRWLTLGMTVAASGRVDLTVDGNLFASAALSTPLASVGGRGLAIGNAHDHPGGGPLMGAIDEIRIWRYHPDSVLDNFCSRPLDAGAASCWADLAGRLEAALGSTPDCVQALRLGISDVLGRTLRHVGGLDASTRAKLSGLLETYLALWKAGAITGPAMEAVTRRIFDLLRATGLNLAADPALGALAGSSCMVAIQARLGRFDCDPAFLGFLDGIAGAQALALPGGR